MSDGRVIFETQLDAKGFQSGLQGLESPARKQGSLLGSIIGGSLLSGGIQKALGTVKDSIGDAFGRLDTIRQFNKVMNTLTGDAQVTADAMAKIDDAVTGTAYTLDSGAQAVQSFVSSGMDVDKATDTFKAATDMVAFYGDGSTTALADVSDAIAKMTAKGKIDMGQMNRLTLQGIPAVQIFADATGQSMGDVQTALSKGTLKTDEFFTTLTAALNDGTAKFPCYRGCGKRCRGFLRCLDGEYQDGCGARCREPHYRLRRGFAKSKY